MGSGVLIIAGIDEAGRGALAGPVVAGACILTHHLVRRRLQRTCWSPFTRKRNPDVLIADSKQLSPREREIAYEWITANCEFGVGIISERIIDRIGIVSATEAAMRLALQDLRHRACPDFLKIDGCDPFSFDCPHESIIRGDAKEPCIAAASIVAKVSRDRLMVNYHRDFPAYDFHAHKGYGTARHIEYIQELGPCSLHRKYFLTRILSTSIQESARSRRKGRTNHNTAPTTKSGRVRS